MVLVLVLVLKDSLRTYFKSLSLSWSLGVRSLFLSLGSQVQEVLVLILVLGGQVLVLVLVLGGQVLVLVLVLMGQVLVNIPATLLAGEPSASFGSLKTALFSLGLSHWKRL